MLQKIGLQALKRKKIHEMRSFLMLRVLWKRRLPNLYRDSGMRVRLQAEGNETVL
jgi:hypothetical protein